MKKTKTKSVARRDGRARKGREKRHGGLRGERNDKTAHLRSLTSGLGCKSGEFVSLIRGAVRVVRIAAPPRQRAQDPAATSGRVYLRVI